MKSKVIALRHLIRWLASMVVVTHGFAQTSSIRNPAFTNLSNDQLKMLRQKWEKESTTNIFKMADAGDPVAQYFYWLRLYNESAEELHQAADRMFTAMNGMTEERRTAAMAKWEKVGDADLARAAASGDKEAQMVSGYRGQGQAVENAAKAFEWDKRSVEQGFPLAEYDAAMLYLGKYNWRVISIDQQQGFEFLKRAADHNYSFAQYQLGMLYVAAELTPPDDSQALKYLRMAADQGGPQSQYELAQLYASGIGEPRSVADTPLVLLQRSATNGNSSAKHALAERYRIGLGVPVDYIQAIRYYEAAAETAGSPSRDFQISSSDIFNLVDENLQSKSDNEPEWSDFAKVLSDYLKATQRKDTDAMSQLAEWYLTGQFVPPNPVEAWAWLAFARDEGNANAEAKMRALEGKMTSQQIASARERFNELKKAAANSTSL